jgi:hypothetical protein
MQVCYDITGMSVINIVLGAAMLLWSHLVWLLMLVLNMWRFYDFNVVDGPAAALEPTSESPSVGKEPAGRGADDVDAGPTSGEKQPLPVGKRDFCVHAPKGRPSGEES